MTEKNLIIDGLTISYQGIFDFKELFSLMERILEQRGYQIYEKRSEENLDEKGRNAYYEYRPIKKINEALSLMIKIRITTQQIREVTKEIGKLKRYLQEGKIEIIFDGIVITDYENQLRQRPVYNMLRGLINKWVYPISLEEKKASQLKEDINLLYHELKGYLEIRQRWQGIK